MNAPRISVCIPCYNAAHWLSSAIESLLNQSYRNFEIIIINDGSTDDSPAILAEYARNHPRKIHLAHQANAGQSAAANHALHLSRGDYVKFFDADDLLSPDMIERQVRALAGHPGAVAYGEWARFHNKPEEARFVSRPGWHDASPVAWLTEIWQDGQPMMQCGQFLIPRAILDRTGGWNERLSLINDFEFFARVVLASDGIVFTPQARLYYRSGVVGSLSGQKTSQAWHSAAQSLRLGTDYLLAAENSPRTRRAASAILQTLVYDMYPNAPAIVADLEARISTLGGSDIRPLGGKGFLVSRYLVGWKVARWLQIWAGKRSRPSTA